MKRMRLRKLLRCVSPGSSRGSNRKATKTRTLLRFFLALDHSRRENFPTRFPGLECLLPKRRCIRVDFSQHQKGPLCPTSRGTITMKVPGPENRNYIRTFHGGSCSKRAGKRGRGRKMGVSRIPGNIRIDIGPRRRKPSPFPPRPALAASPRGFTRLRFGRLPVQATAVEEDAQGNED